MVIIAIILSLLAMISGLLVVGSGKHFDYELRDIIRGRDNALLYIWVTASTMFTMVHFAILTEFGLRYNFGPQDDQTFKWMTVHAVVGLLFIAAHAFVHRSLYRTDVAHPRYLWGAQSSA